MWLYWQRLIYDQVRSISAANDGFFGCGGTMPLPDGKSRLAWFAERGIFIDLF